MKKNPLLVVLTIVTILAVIYGTCVHILGWGDGNFGPIWSIHRGSDVNEERDGGRSSSDELTGVSFEEIYVDCDVASVTIASGDDYLVNYHATRNVVPTMEIDGNCLKITQHNKSVKMVGTNKCDVHIEIPKEVSLKSIVVKSAVGDVKIRKIEAASLDVDSDVGDVRLTDVNIPEISLKSDVGDVSLDSCNVINVDVQSSVGDVKLSSSVNLDEYAFDLATDIGDVEVNNAEYRGGFKQNGTAGNITLIGATGDIEVTY